MLQQFSFALSVCRAHLLPWEHAFPNAAAAAAAVLRGGIQNRTYGAHKNLPGMHLPIFTDNIYYGGPQLTGPNIVSKDG